MAADSTAAEEPSLTLTGESFVPVNANKTNGSRWQSFTDSDPSDKSFGPPQTRDKVGLPLIRDFNVSPMRDLSGWDGSLPPPPITGPFIADPELKAFTASLNNAGVTQIAYRVTYTSATEGGRVQLWQEATKENPVAVAGSDNLGFWGALPASPSCTFFVEGTSPSTVLDDVSITIHTPERQVGPPPIRVIPAFTTTKMLSVTPIVNAFSITLKNPPATTFVKRGNGDVIGMTSGRQSADGVQNGPASGEIGAKFSADLIRSGIQGEGRFIHIINAFDNGLPNNKAMTISNGLSMGWGPKSGYSLPLVDSVAGAEPFYYIILSSTNTADRHVFESEDTPAFGVTTDEMGTSTMTKFDLTFKATLNLVWKFAGDGTVYNLAEIGWQTIFRASLDAQGVLTRDAASVTSITRPAAPATYTVTNGDPVRMSIPAFSTSYEKKF